MKIRILICFVCLFLFGFSSQFKMDEPPTRPDTLGEAAKPSIDTTLVSECFSVYEKSYTNGAKCLKKNAAGGDPWSIYYLGRAYELNLGVESNYEKMASNYRKAANLGVGTAWSNLAVYEEGKNDRLEYPKLAYENNDYHALITDANHYVVPEGVPLSYRIEKGYRLMSPFIGNPLNLENFTLLKIVMDADGIVKNQHLRFAENDFQKAYDYIEDQANKGNALAVRLLAGERFVQGDRAGGDAGLVKAAELGDLWSIEAIVSKYGYSKSPQEQALYAKFLRIGEEKRIPSVLHLAALDYLDKDFDKAIMILKDAVRADHYPYSKLAKTKLRMLKRRGRLPVE